VPNPIEGNRSPLFNAKWGGESLMRKGIAGRNTYRKSGFAMRLLPERCEAPNELTLVHFTY
jgi:hypothetical protein